MQDSKVPKGQNEPLDEPIERSLEEKILYIMLNTPNCTYDSMTEILDISRSTVKRAVKNLAENGTIERKGGKRYGYWEVHKILKS